MFNTYLEGLVYLDKLVTFNDLMDGRSSIVTNIIENHYHKYRIFYNLLKDVSEDSISSVSVSLTSSTILFSIEPSSNKGDGLFDYLINATTDICDTRFSLRITETDSGEINIFIGNIHFEREEDMPYED